MIMFITLQTGYLFTEFQTVYTGCFKNETVAEYNKNIQQMKILLFPTLNDSCNILTQPISASLILKNDSIPILYTIDQNFNYQNTTELIFTGVPDFETESFMILHIYTYSLIVEVNIFYFDEILSEIASCYTKLSSMIVTQNQFQLTVSSTGLCRQQIQTQTNAAGEITSEVIGAILTVDGITVEIDFAQFVNSYDQIGVNFTYTGNEVFPGIREKAIVYGRMVFTVQQGAAVLTLTTFIDFVNIQGLGIEFYNQSKLGISLVNQVFHVYVENAQPFENIRAQVDGIGFSHYIKRLTAVAGGSQVILEEIIYKTTYNENQTFISLDCQSGSLQNQILCISIFTAAINEGGTFYFDTLFYDDDIFKDSEKAVLAIYPSCWTQAFIESDHDAICLSVVRQVNVFGCLLEHNDIVQSNIQMRFSNQDEMLSNFINMNMSLSINETKFCYDCDQNVTFCNEISSSLKKKDAVVQITFSSLDQKVNFNDQKLTLITQKQESVNYLIMTILVITLGCIFIIVCAVISIYGIVFALKIQKKLKQKQKK